MQYVDAVQWALAGGSMEPGILLIRRVRRQHGDEVADLVKKELEAFLLWVRTNNRQVQTAWPHLLERLKVWREQQSGVANANPSV